MSITHEDIQLMKLAWEHRTRVNYARAVNRSFQYATEEEIYATGKREVEEMFLKESLFQGIDFKRWVLLEIGCGIGRMTRFLAPLFRKVVAIDVSSEMIKRARKCCRAAVIRNVTFRETNGVNLAGLPYDYFDVVICIEVFTHIPKKQIIFQYLCEIYRVLKKGGFFIGTFNTDKDRLRCPNTLYGDWPSAKELRRWFWHIGYSIRKCIGRSSFLILQKPLSGKTKIIQGDEFVFPKQNRVEMVNDWATKFVIGSFNRHKMLEILNFYNHTKEALMKRLLDLRIDRSHRVALFGAAETGELVYMALRTMRNPPKVVAVVDNNPYLQREKFLDIYPILPPEHLKKLKIDAVVICSTGAAKAMKKQIRSLKQGCKVVSVC